MQTSTMIIAGIAVLQLACGGSVRTEVLSPGRLTDGKKFEGVVYYAPHYVKLVYQFKTRIDKEGKIFYTCGAVTQKEELMLLPDVGKPMLISNAAKWFSAAKFAVTLNSGMLASVNSEPTQKLSDVLNALPALLPLAPGILATADSLACNAGPVLVGFQEIP